MKIKLKLVFKTEKWRSNEKCFWLGFCADLWRWQVKERPDVGVYVKDLSTFVVNNADDMDRIMTLGNKNR